MVHVPSRRSLLVWIREQAGCADAAVRNAWRYRRCRYHGGLFYHEPRGRLCSAAVRVDSVRLCTQTAIREDQPARWAWRWPGVCSVWLDLIKVGGFDSASSAFGRANCLAFFPMTVRAALAPWRCTSARAGVAVDGSRWPARTSREPQNQVPGYRYLAKTAPDGRCFTRLVAAG
jgi:hypothetical protein